MALDGDPSEEHCILCRRPCKKPIVVLVILPCCGRDMRLCEDGVGLVERMTNMTPERYIEKLRRFHTCLTPRTA